MNQTLQEQIFVKLWRAFGPIGTCLSSEQEAHLDYVVTNLSYRLARYEHRGDLHITNILDYLEDFGGNSL